MAKSSPVQSDLSSAEPMTLQEFCILLSNSDRRVELIAAFNHTETLSGRIKDTAVEYQTRFNAFANKPV